MGCACFLYAAADRDALSWVWKWLVLCALQDDCLAHRRGMGVVCHLRGGKANYDHYAGCHRYDQSALNLLLANRHRHRWHDYFRPFNLPKPLQPSPQEYRPQPLLPPV